ncbi:MAG TPA: hypothetical protein V6D20_25340 [Candidatus Obscuribacterales bacterium]
MSKPDQSGITLREHLEQVEKQTRKTPKELMGPEFPSEVSHIWSAFILLNQSRTAGLNGPNPITYEQIKAWKELTETPISAWEIEAIRKLDTVFLRVLNG